MWRTEGWFVGKGEIELKKKIHHWMSILQNIYSHEIPAVGRGYLGVTIKILRHGYSRYWETYIDIVQFFLV